MLRALIIDDESLARDELKYLLRKTKQVEVVGEAESVAEAISQIAKCNPDIVFLDIQLSDDSGLAVDKYIKTLPRQPLVVFATAYDEFAITAFDLNVADYLLKPFSEARLQKTLEKCNRLRSAQAAALDGEAPSVNKIAITMNDKILLTDIADIIYIGLFDKKTVIKTKDKLYESKESLSQMESKLPKKVFLRVHRAFLVNLSYINEIEPWFNSTVTLVMTDGSKIPVSRTYVNVLKSRFGL